MRLFIAVNFNDNVKDSLCNAMTGLKKQGVTGRFSARGNLHLTLVFIGETGRAEDIKAVMDSIAVSPFALSICGLGTFRREGGDILWAGIKSENTLYEIQSGLTNSLIQKGFMIENRKYNPHLTLARRVALPSELNITGILPEIKTAVNHISLMKSERVNGKLVYTEIYRNL